MIAAVIAACAAATVPPIITGVIYAEWGDVLALVVTAGLALGIGIAGRRFASIHGVFTSSEGFAAVALSWLLLIVFGTLPYILAGALDGFVDPLFETAAGFTTTGATVFDDPGALSHSMLVWRATTQWVGGMGIIILSIAVLPVLGAGGVELARAEAPGPEPDRMTPRFRDTAERLWWLYTGLTAVLALLLALGDMSGFQAIVHALTTISTGGFSTEPSSLAGFGAYTQWIIVAFMLIAATSFALHFRAWRRPKVYMKSAEFVAFVSIIGGAILLVALGTWSLGSGIESRLRDAVFTAVTMVTGTGFATVDWASWAPGVLSALVVFMFFGGMAGSTSGGMKTYRLGIIYKTIGSSLQRIVYPRVVAVQRFGGRPVEPRLVHGVMAFFVLYIGFFVAGAILLGFFEPGLDLVTVGSASASAMGNVGPALGGVGPTSNYAALGSDSKLLLSLLMVIGRLEIFPVVMLVTHRWWRR